jgi:folate-binding protein YgfZ
MPFKTTLPAEPLSTLAGFGQVVVEGAQSGAFLQAQAMNDVAALAVGEWQWNGWLSAKGRVLALFALLRTGEEAYRLVLPDVPATQLRDELSRFVFRSKVRLSVPEGAQCAAQWPVAGASRPDDARHVAAFVDGAWRLDCGGDDAVRWLWLLPPDARVVVNDDAASDARWRAEDLRHGFPRLAPAQREAWTPQMLSLGRLNAYSLKKGCYPGQEIVARTHYLGQAKRELALLRGDGLVEGAAITAGDGFGAGTVVCAATEHRLALAVVNAGTVDHSTPAAGVAVERLPLTEGLKRPQ